MANGTRASTAWFMTTESKSLMPMRSSAAWATVLSFSGRMPICWANARCALLSALLTSAVEATASISRRPSSSFFCVTFILVPSPSYEHCGTGCRVEAETACRPQCDTRRNRARTFPSNTLLACNCNAHRRPPRRDARKYKAMSNRLPSGKKRLHGMRSAKPKKGERGAGGLFRGFNLRARAAHTVQHAPYYTERPLQVHYTKGPILRPGLIPDVPDSWPHAGKRAP